ncbi:hypothetical protein J5N97_017132 [Dioscorea zingiberensis]|uniref:Myb/SANT-like domain-containing protein n=1 Tax=Dioscorea zingiberensis TaxID=325984 RepID=A0A9D5HGA1_9LILI|nr:hypothetical protein J5N97_017132 [Dioscorea zingiberensis]
MDADNVENRLRTLKIKYQELKKIMGLSGVGWNDTSKMLVLEIESYRTYVESFPKAKDLLSKPIPYYDDLRIVCGDDHATGDFARSIFDRFGSDDPDTEGNNKTPTNELEHEFEPPVPPEPNDQQREFPRHTSSASTARTGRASRLSNKNFIMDHFGEKFDGLSASIEASKPKPWKLMLSDALWSMEGYSDADLDMVFDILREDKKLAKGFYLRKLSLRKIWLDNFIANKKGSE